TAGILLAAGSAVGIVARLLLGMVADRHVRLHFVILPVLLGAGAGGFGLRGGAHSTVGLGAVTFVVYAAGWAWPALINFAVVHRNPRAPGIASGILGTGQFGGGILGPLVFGVVVERSSYRLAWWLVAGMVAVAAVLM